MFDVACTGARPYNIVATSKYPALHDTRHVAGIIGTPFVVNRPYRPSNGPF